MGPQALVLPFVQIPQNALQVGEFDLFHVVLVNANTDSVASEPMTCRVKERFQYHPDFMFGVGEGAFEGCEIVAHQGDVYRGFLAFSRHILPKPFQKEPVFFDGILSEKPVFGPMVERDNSVFFIIERNRQGCPNGVMPGFMLGQIILSIVSYFGQLFLKAVADGNTAILAFQQELPKH